MSRKNKFREQFSGLSRGTARLHGNICETAAETTRVPRLYLARPGHTSLRYAEEADANGCRDSIARFHRNYRPRESRSLAPCLLRVDNIDRIYDKG